MSGARAGFVAALATALALTLAACAKPATSNSSAAATAAGTAGVKHPASANDGARVYITNCSSCHQIDGRGVSGAFPPLAGNPVVTGDSKRVIAIVKFGSRGRERVEGRDYDGVMPAWNGLISDADIADVVTYIRSAWNNAAPPVDAP